MNICEICGQAYEWFLELDTKRCAACVLTLSKLDEPVREMVEGLARRVLQLEGKKPGSQVQLDETEKALVRDGQLILAIRTLRARTGLGLVEAKNIVDDYRWRR